MDNIINSILDSPEVSDYADAEESSQQSFLSNEKFAGSVPDLSNEVDANIAALLRRSLPKIQMFGVGGAGNNSTARLMRAGVKDVEIVAVNTDAQDLLNTLAHKKVLIGYQITKGFGAGADPAIGENAARESSEELKDLVTGDLVFVTAGMGGGTGTGAAHVVADLAKSKGSLAISICTLPFNMEGPVRRAK